MNTIQVRPDGSAPISALYGYAFARRVAYERVTDWLTEHLTSRDRELLSTDLMQITVDTYESGMDWIDIVPDRMTDSARGAHMEKLASRIRDRLRALGDSADEIAASLRTLGVSGSTGTTCACPLAIFIRQNTAAVAVSVTHEHIELNGYILHTPSPAQVFIDEFDAKSYPELIRNPNEPTEFGHFGV